jgi:DNA-binding MarR family transcriptional regulator
MEDIMASSEDIIKAMSTDALSRIVDEWGLQRPDLDTSPMLVVGRIFRLAQAMDVALRPPFAAAGLAQHDFDVLAALRRAEPPHSRTPGELRDSLMVTSGAVTKQVDRLLSKGLVTRDVAADDARGRTITLTADGVGLVDELMPRHLDNQRRLLSILTEAQASELGTLLALLAEQLEAGTA